VAGGGRGFDGSVGLCTQFLTGGLTAPPRRRAGGDVWGGAQSSRSETLKHQRERHYPENKKTITRKHGKQRHTGPEKEKYNKQKKKLKN